MGRPRTKHKELPPRLVPRQAKDGTVRYYYDHGVINGRRWREPLGKDLAKARRLWAEREDQTPASGTFAALAAEYLEQGTGSVAWRKKPLSERGIADAQAHIEALNRVFGQTPPTEITSEDVAAYLSMRSAPVRANREVATLSSIMKYGQRTRQVTANPTQGVPRNAESARDHVPSDKDFMAAREQAPAIIALGMDFAYLTGMRLGDMLRLAVPEDKDGIYYREGKTGQAHIVEWDDALRDIVRRTRELTPDKSTTLFANRKGEAYTVNGWESMWQRTLRKAVDKGATRFTWHDLRAKAATDAHAAGQNSQALLGHKSERQHLAYLRARTPLRAKPVRKREE